MFLGLEFGKNKISAKLGLRVKRVLPRHYLHSSCTSKYLVTCQNKNQQLPHTSSKLHKPPQKFTNAIGQWFHSLPSSLQSASHIYRIFVPGAIYHSRPYKRVGDILGSPMVSCLEDTVLRYAHCTIPNDIQHQFHMWLSTEIIVS